MRVPVLFSLLLCLLIGCDGGTRGTGTSITVGGSVKLAGNLPASGVVVTVDSFDTEFNLVDSSSVETGRAGQFSSEVQGSASIQFKLSGERITAELPLIPLPENATTLAAKILVTSARSAELVGVKVEISNEREAPQDPDPAAPTPTPPPQEPGGPTPQPTAEPGGGSSPTPTPMNPNPSGTPTVSPTPATTPTPAPGGEDPGAPETPTPTPTPDPPPGDDDDDSGGPSTVTLCHVNQGNGNNNQTREVPESAVAAHLAHGDYLGPC